MVAALAVLAGTLVGGALSVQPARAVGFDFECAVGSGDAANRGPEFGGSGGTALVPLLTKEDVDPSQSKSGEHEIESDYTLWEVSEGRGLLWSYTPSALTGDFKAGNPKSSFDEQCSLMDAASTYIAQMLWEPSRFLGALTITVKQQASVEQPFAEFYDGRDSLVQHLRDSVFIPALVVAVALTGFWIASRVHRRADARETYAGVAGAAVIVILVAAVLTGSFFRAITDVVDEYTVTFNSAAMSLASPNPEDDPSGPCYIPDQSVNSSAGDRHIEYNKGKRLSSCLLYQVLLYNPWSSGQFGDARPHVVESLEFGGEDYCRYSPYRCASRDRPIGADGSRADINLAVQQVIAQGLTRNETDYTKVAHPNEVELTRARHALWQGVLYAVADSYEVNYEFWRGTQPTTRMATAVSALVLNGIAVILVGLLAILTVFWHGVFFMAWLFLPIAGAFAAFPPARRILKANVGILVQAVFLRNVFGLLLALMLAVLNMLSLSEGRLAIKIFLMLIAAAAIWKVLGSIRSGMLGPTTTTWAQTHGLLPDDRRTTSAVAATTRSEAMRFAAGAAGGLVAARAMSNREGGYRRYSDLVGGLRAPSSRDATADRREGGPAASESVRTTRVARRYEVEEPSRIRRAPTDGQQSDTARGRDVPEES